MFAELKTLLDSCSSVSIILANGTDDTVNVTVIPKVKDGQNAVLSTPLALSGTLEDMDAEFAQIVSSYTAKRTSLSEQLEATQTILEAAKDDAAKGLAESRKNKSLPKPKMESSGSTGKDDDDDDDNKGDEGCCMPAITAAVPKAASDDLWA
jgi:PRTRC genetic system protein E